MIRLALPVFVLLLPLVCKVSAADTSASVDFAHEIVPVLQKHCASCHGGEHAEGGFSLNTKELFLESAAASPGRPTESLFLELITSTDSDLQMPPPENPRLSDAEQELLVRWVGQGMAWQPGFTFARDRYEAPVRLADVSVPSDEEILNQNIEHPVDRFVARFLIRESRQAASPADDRVFLRRVFLDLIGLLPTPDQTKSFVEDPDSNKRQEIVDELLSDSHAYTEHWLSFWNDWLRNDYTGTGFITKGRTQITPWLYASLYDNAPLDQMIRDLIAPEIRDSRGFIDGIKWRGTVSAGQTLPIQFAQSVGQTFLGINLKCASCHDSFIDKWRLKDAYGLAAIYAEETLSIHRCDKPTGETAAPEFLLPEIGRVDASLPRDARLKQLADLLTSRENGMMPRAIVNRIWAALMGRGIVEPLDAMIAAPAEPELLDFLAKYLQDKQFDLKAVIRLIATSDAYAAKLQSDPSELEAVPKRLTAEQFMDTVWQITQSAPPRMTAALYAADMEMRSTRMVRASLLANDFLMKSLGRPSRDQIVPSRPRELTTLEAIDLANGETLAGYLRKGSVRLSKTHATTSALAKHLMVFAYGREPTDEEITLLVEALGEQCDLVGAEDVLWSVLMSPEFFVLR